LEGFDLDTQQVYNQSAGVHKVGNPLQTSQREFDYYKQGIGSVNLYDPLNGIGKVRLIRGSVQTDDSPFDLRNRDLQYNSHLPWISRSVPEASSNPIIYPESNGEVRVSIGPLDTHPVQQNWGQDRAFQQDGVRKMVRQLH